MLFGQIKISKHWNVGFETQCRRNDWGRLPQQLLLRTGINYELNKNVTLTSGYCFVKTYPYGKFPVQMAFPENRIWEQVQFKHQIGRLEQINRIRLEQRFSNLPILNSDSLYKIGKSIYTNRLRILNRFSVPFKGKEIVDNSLYLTLYDELFFGFGKQIGTNFIDQNRAYIAIGYKIPKLGRLEIGYMQHTVFKNANINTKGQITQIIENNHTLQLALNVVLDYTKKEVNNGN